jgi:sulfur-oxidizing protein SoxY
MALSRRTALKGILATTVLPTVVMADWPQKAFEANTVDDAIKALFESQDVEESQNITIDAPKIAENGAVVPIEIKADFAKVDSITIIGDKNPVPLIGQFNFFDNAEGYVKTRIKLGGTSNVVAVVKAEGKLYVARRAVKVTLGGCGG